MRKPAPADARLSAERMRAAFSSPAGTTALLQRRVPASGTAMVALDGSAKLSGDGGGKDKRNEQSRRYRERVRKRKQPAPEEAVAGAARVITTDFFRPLLR